MGRFAGISQWTKPMAFQWQKWQSKKANRAFKKQFPFQVLPPDKWLFETFQIDYGKYQLDGALCAKEIIHWSRPYLPEDVLWKILDWGCGTARVTQHLHQNAPYSLLYGADINAEIIQWNSQHINGIHFNTITQAHSLPYPSHFFNLVYGISVFTHLTIQEQIAWLDELLRVMESGGILILSTHGSYFNKQLSKKQLGLLEKQGFLELVEGAKGTPIGDRNFAVYQDFHVQKAHFEINFNIIQSYQGQEYPQIMGGQDLWILQKK
jgi:ubiquinone/menaquinone biosynthesis C-methylase UbiE